MPSWKRRHEGWLVTDPAKHADLMARLGKNSYYLSLELPRLQARGVLAQAIRKH